MNRYGCGAALFCNPRNLHSIYMLLIKAFTEFHGDGLVNRLYGTADNLFDKLRILHQCRALTIIYHLWNRTAHVDIQNIKWLFLNPLCHLTDNYRIRAKQLQGYRMLSRISLHEFFGIPVLIINCLGTHHFHADKAGTLFCT